MPSTSIAQKVSGVRFFYFVNSFFFFLNFYAYCPSFFNFIFRSFRQSLNGDCWRGLFSPPKPIAQMAVGGEGPFFFLFFFFVYCPFLFSVCFFFFQFLPLSQSLNGDWWRGLFSPPKPIAQMAVGGEGPFLFLNLLNLFFNFCLKPITQW